MGRQLHLKNNHNNPSEKQSSIRGGRARSWKKSFHGRKRPTCPLLFPHDHDGPQVVPPDHRSRRQPVLKNVWDLLSDGYYKFNLTWTRIFLKITTLNITTTLKISVISIPRSQRVVLLPYSCHLRAVLQAAPPPYLRHHHCAGRGVCHCLRSWYTSRRACYAVTK